MSRTIRLVPLDVFQLPGNERLMQRPIDIVAQQIASPPPAPFPAAQPLAAPPPPGGFAAAWAPIAPAPPTGAPPTVAIPTVPIQLVELPGPELDVALDGDGGQLLDVASGPGTLDNQWTNVQPYNGTAHHLS